MHNNLRRFHGVICGLLVLEACLLVMKFSRAQDGQPPARKPGNAAAKVNVGEVAKKAGSGPVSLNPKGTVALDKAKGKLIVKTKVVLREGLLEMLACPVETKEHESILAVDAPSSLIHAGLLALDATPGKPVRYLPEFTPPQGPQIDIFLNWTDENGKARREPAQSWIRNSVHRYFIETLARLPADLKLDPDGPLRYDEKHQELIWFGPMTKEERDRLLKLSRDKTYAAAINKFFNDSQSRQMEAKWVFAGSIFEVDEKTGEKFYMADGGDLICVANFPTATIDVAMASSASGEENLLFEAWTEHIPPLGTEVTMELVPVKGK